MKDLSRCISSILMAFASSSKPVVIVSGAGGKTGGALLQKLLQDSNYRTIGLVRTEASKASVLSKLPNMVASEDIVVVDITNEQSVRNFFHQLNDVPIRALCIATSATPIPTGGTTQDGRPIFGFPNGQPEIVDWMGCKHQMEACPDGTHVILCSTMGGTNPNHPLNRIGRNGDTGGMIVQYKRKAEMYLMNHHRDRLQYTIVHPGGLTDDIGGQREILFGVDDQLKGNIPRQDVAAIMYEAVKRPDVFAGRSFDVVSTKEVGTTTKDFVSLMQDLKVDCDYSLGVIAV